jgi:hypothetical protein
VRAWRKALVHLCGYLALIVLVGGARPAAVQEQDYLLIVKQLADSGKLTDPDEAARLLGTTLTSFNDSFTDYSAPRFGPCKFGKLESDETHNFRPADDFWYKPQLPPGARAPFFGSSFSYQTSKELDCVGRHSVDPKYSATLYFLDLDEFSCISADDLKSNFPGIVLGRGTHGGEHYDYKGFAAEDSGIFVTFDVRFGSRCSPGVTIVQDYLYGARAQRARAKFNSCVSEHFKVDPQNYPDYEDCSTFRELYEKD